MKRQAIEIGLARRAMYSALEERLTGAQRNPVMEPHVLRREDELLPQFAAQYQKLTVLPRRARRGLQRQWKRSLGGIALMLTLGAQPALAATINVGGQCTLVRAIVSANNDFSAQGFCRPGRGADQIVLPRYSIQILTRANNTNYGPTGLPTIRSIITIVGNGSTIRRTASAPPFRLLAVAERGDLTASLALSNITLTGGRAARNNVSDYSSDGGALLNRGGRITLTNSRVTGNVAVTGGGISINYHVLYAETGGFLALINSTVSGNRSTGRGGGIENSNYSLVSITNSTVSGNSAGTDGGGVYNGYASRVTAVNSTISGNVAVSGNGGGLYNQENSIRLTHTTVTGNRADARGGGIHNRDNGALTLTRSLISGNRAPQGSEVFRDAEFGGEVTAARYNIFGHSGNAGVVGFTPGTTDIVPTQPLASVLNTRLANNGGATLTHALVNGSPAIDAVNDGTCPPPATDQRGLSRLRDGNRDGGVACDIGAVEALGPPGAASVTAPVQNPAPEPPDPPPPVIEPPPPPPLDDNGGTIEPAS